MAGDRRVRGRVTRVRLGLDASPVRANSLVGRPVVPFVNGDEPISRAFLLRVFFELGDRRERVAVRGVRVIDECNASLERASGKGQSQADQADIPHRRAPQPLRIRRTVSNQPESGRHLASAPRAAQVARSRRGFVRLLHETAGAGPPNFADLLDTGPGRSRLRRCAATN